MRVIQIQQLDDLLAHINETNDLDLDWRWCGNDIMPRIEVYEEAERHVLTTGYLEEIRERVLLSLTEWGLIP